MNLEFFCRFYTIAIYMKYSKKIENVGERKKFEKWNDKIEIQHKELSS